MRLRARTRRLRRSQQRESLTMVSKIPAPNQRWDFWNTTRRSGESGAIMRYAPPVLTM
jgi:hypothetical protein